MRLLWFGSVLLAAADWLANTPCYAVADLGIVKLNPFVINCGPNATIVSYGMRWLSCSGSARGYQYQCHTVSQGECTLHYTPYDSGENRPVYFLDRHLVSCPAGTVMSYFEVDRSGNGGGPDIRYIYRCCPTTLGTCRPAPIPCFSDGTGAQLQVLTGRIVQCNANEGLQYFRLIQGTCPSGWVHIEATCCEIQCPGLTWSDSHLTSSCSQNVQQTISAACNFGCVPGYIVSGTPSILCNDDSTWSANVPSCQVCPQGKYQHLNACDDCAAGYYSNATGASSSSTCIACPIGFWSVSVGANSSATCIPCGAGAYGSPSSLTSCADCVEGKFSNASAATSPATCINCDAGKFSLLRAGNCMVCPAGMYGGLFGLSACLNCSTGKYQNSTGSIFCDVCAMGTYSMAIRATSVGTCVSCAAGKWNDAVAASGCTNCDAGRANAGSRSITVNDCVQCAAGAWSAVGASVCTPCLAGNFSAVMGATSQNNCTFCNPGTWSAIGASNCTACLAGTYNGLFGQNSSAACTKCVVGRWSSQVQATSNASCVPCHAGSFGNSTGASSSSDCPSCGLGTFSVAVGATSLATCQGCPAGTWSAITGAINCNLCDPGTWSASISASNSTVCVPCGAGRYNSIPGQGTNCTGCGLGTSSIALGATSPTSCASCRAGTYNSVSGASICSNCSLGRASASVGSNSSSVCIFCGAGMYQNTTAATQCNLCDRGRYFAGTGATNPLDCNACASGRYSATDGAISAASCLNCTLGRWLSTFGTTLSDCMLCASGKYSNISGATICIDCPQGSFLDALGATSVADCTSCPSGKFTTSNGSGTFCQDCAAGRWSSTYGASSNTTCLACIAGTYNSFQGVTSSDACILCPAGTWSSTISATSSIYCLACQPGRFSNGTGANDITQCSPCDPGTYGTQASLTVCAQCSAGKWSSAAGANSTTTCSNCSAGTANNITGSPAISFCLGCGVGQYALAGQSACTSCLAGTASTQLNATNVTTCIVCFPGQWSSTGAASCISCDQGKYSTQTQATAETTCIACPAGTASNVSGAGALTNCTNCSPGKWSGTSASVCTSCAAGKWSSDLGGTNESVCQACAPGRYNALSGSVNVSACLQCGVGKYNPFNGSITIDACLNCSLGTWSNDSVAISGLSCHTCSAGKASNTSGAGAESACFPCDLGSWSPVGAVVCNLCAAGKWNNVSQSGVISDCVNCLTGTYSPTLGASSGNNCTPCGAGRFSGVIGAASNATCDACSAGKWSNISIAASASACHDCAAGTANGLAGMSSSAACKDCSAGSWALLGSANCTLCVAGRWSGDLQAKDVSTCIECFIGTWSDVLGANSSATCKNCTQGRFSANPGAGVDCDICAAGFYAPVMSTRCFSCLAGSWAAQGSGSCTVCAPGRWGSLPEASSILGCQLCPLGTFNELAGSSSLGDCLDCVPGRSNPSDGSTTCQNCTLGKYAGSGASLCQDCLAGRYSAIAAATDASVCVPCAPGTAQNLTGASACQSCSLGSWSLQAQSSCTTCPPGTWSDVVQSSNPADCNLCEAGKWSNISGAGLNTCVGCWPGTSSSVPGAVSIFACVGCAAGSWSGGNASACTNCAEGRWSSVAQSTSSGACIACNPGRSLQYSGATSPTSCLICNAGTWAYAGFSQCTQCDRGQWSSLISAISPTTCQNCTSGKYNPLAGASASSACIVCPGGRYGAGNGAKGLQDCVACVAGKYSTVTGSTSVTNCDLCSPGEFSPAGAFSCAVLPQCVFGRVYVLSNSCPSGFNLSSPLPGRLANTTFGAYGRCPSFDDNAYCRGWADGWTDNMVLNPLGQIQNTTYWAIVSGSFVNLGVGNGFASFGSQSQPALRAQLIDLKALGLLDRLLNTLPWVRFKVELQTTGPLNYYEYRVEFRDEFGQPFGPGLIKNYRISTSQNITFDARPPSVGSRLQFIYLEEKAYDTGTLPSSGPTIANIGIYLNIDECDTLVPVCHSARTCIDQLVPFPLCAPCSPAERWKDVGATECEDINECLQITPVCGANTLCVNSRGNFSCSCLAGFEPDPPSLACRDIDECANYTCLYGRCQNQLGSTSPLCLPYAENCSLTVDSMLNTSCEFSFPSNAGGQTLGLSLHAVLNTTIDAVFIGSTANPGRFRCGNLNITGELVQCDVPEGLAGRFLAVAVRVCFPATTLCYLVSTRSAGVLHFPTPTIFNGTLRAFPDSVGGSHTQGKANAGESIAFDGDNFMLPTFASPEWKVTYSNGNFTHTCDPSAEGNTTTLVCVTVPGIGSDYVFQINWTQNEPLVVGTDTFSYPAIPTVTRISGCIADDTTDPPGIMDCPTEGGVPIQIEGRDFGSYPTFTVGGEPCSRVELIKADHRFNCTLPPGSGRYMTLTVSSSALFSLPVRAVSYAAPTIESVSGCNSSLGVLHTGDCKRLGGSQVTIRGQSFGPLPPIVIIGSYQCVPAVTVPHREIVCTLGPGNQQQLVVVLFQAGGSLGLAKGFVSYLRCEPGFYEDDIYCSECPSGWFSALRGQTECLECSPGTVSAPGSASCSSCGAGRFGPTNSSTCSDCEIGTAQDAAVSQACDPCTPGTYADKTRSQYCNNCQKGTYQPDSNSTYCLLCPIGTYSDQIGASSCAGCDLGRFAPALNGSVSCEDCPPGNYQSQVAQTSCTLCDAGKFAAERGSAVCLDCVPGKRAESSGMSTCSRCDSGFYQLFAGMVDCIPCEAGSHAPAAGAVLCDKCPPGTFSRASPNGTAECGDCLEGTYQRSTGQVTCSACPVGTTSTRQSVSCSPCQTNSFAPIEGTPSCHSCHSLSVPNKEHTRCLCAKGYYSTNATNAAIQCVPCARGAACEQEGVDWLTLGSLAGFWRQDVDSTVFYRCLIPEHCLGGHNSTCGANREGPLCSTCKSGFSGTSDCKPCGSRGQSVGEATGILIVVILAFTAMFVLIIKLADKSVARMKKHAKLKKQMEYSKLSRKKGPSVEEDSEDIAAALARVTKISTMASRRAPSVMHKLKILVGFAQIAEHIANAGDIPWPQTFQSFIQVFVIFNFDFIPWNSLSCIYEIPYITKALVISFIPVGLLILLVLFVFLPLVYLDRRDMTDAQQRALAMQLTRRKFSRLCMFVVFLFYPFVSTTVIGIYNCTVINDVSYLVKDMRMLCESPDWLQGALPMIFFLFLYPFGVPLIYWYLLRKNRYSLRDPMVMLQFGFLYEAFSDERWFFELVDMFHKLVVMALIPFFDDSWEMRATLVALVLYVLVILIYSPYVRKGDDRLHLLVQTNLMLLSLVGHVLRESGATVLDPVTDNLISALLIMFVLIMIVIAFIMTLRNAWKILKLYRRKKLAKKSNENPVVLKESMSTIPNESQNDSRMSELHFHDSQTP